MTMLTKTGLIQTEFDFSLPRGYLDTQGQLHRNGRMRMATGLDEIAPMRDSKVRANQSYLMIAVLARVIIQLGELPEITTEIVESMFTADLNYLQDLYRQINDEGTAHITATCPKCNHSFEVGGDNSGEENNWPGGW